MFYCENCGAFFEEPETKNEYRGEYWGMPTSEAYGVCPYCGNTEFDEASYCKACGEPIPEGEYCEVCESYAETIAQGIKANVSKYAEENLLNYKELLNLVLDSADK